jgi:hypothetical protein
LCRREKSSQLVPSILICSKGRKLPDHRIRIKENRSHHEEMLILLVFEQQGPITVILNCVQKEVEPKSKSKRTKLNSEIKQTISQLIS